MFSIYQKKILTNPTQTSLISHGLWWQVLKDTGTLFWSIRVEVLQKNHTEGADHSTTRCFSPLNLNKKKYKIESYLKHHTATRKYLSLEKKNGFYLTHSLLNFYKSTTCKCFMLGCMGDNSNMGPSQVMVLCLCTSTKLFIF